MSGQKDITSVKNMYEIYGTQSKLLCRVFSNTNKGKKIHTIFFTYHSYAWMLYSFTFKI